MSHKPSEQQIVIVVQNHKPMNIVSFLVLYECETFVFHPKERIQTEGVENEVPRRMYWPKRE
jgi:hypothetical protein